MAHLSAALAVLHIATGIFYTTSGTRKLFMPTVRTKVRHLLASHHVPNPAQWLVIGGEFLGGLGLLFGCETRLAAMGLILIMSGAYAMDTWPGVLRKQAQFMRPLGNTPPLYAVDWKAATDWRKIDYTQLLSNALCTPEAQLLVILVAIALAGAGNFSLDAIA